MITDYTPTPGPVAAPEHVLGVRPALAEEHGGGPEGAPVHRLGRDLLQPLLDLLRPRGLETLADGALVHARPRRHRGHVLRGVHVTVLAPGPHPEPPHHLLHKLGVVLNTLASLMTRNLQMLYNMLLQATIIRNYFVKTQTYIYNIL